jgi:hypothetical protein
MAKIRAGDTVLLRGEVTRVDNEDGTITVQPDGVIPMFVWPWEARRLRNP